MARIYCHQCGTPLPKRAKVCLQCEAAVKEVAAAAGRQRRAIEWLVICCFGVSCLVFVLSLGITNLYRDGGWFVGAGSFACIVFTCFWLSRLEGKNASDPGDSTRR